MERVSGKRVKVESLLGHVFETGFKAGFLFGLRQHNYIQLEGADYFEEKLLTKARELNLDEKFLFFTPGQKPFKDSLIAKLNSLAEANGAGTGTEAGIEIETESKYVYSAYVIGYYEGYCLALEECRRKHIGEKVKKIRFIETLDSPDEVKGSYHHADLLYISQDTLTLYELKGSGLYSFIHDFLRKTPINVPYYPTGFQVRFVTGEIDFISYVRSLMKVFDYESGVGEWSDEYEWVRRLIDIDIDQRNFWQALTYLLDYLYWKYKELRDIRFVKLGVIYALHEWIVFKFSVSDIDPLVDYAEKVRAIYKNIVSKCFPDDWEEAIRILNDEKERIQEKVLQEKRVVIHPAVKMSDLREEVLNRMQEVKAKGPGDYFFLHSMGAGKTTAVIKTFIKREEPLLLFYFAPRKKLIEAFKKEVEKYGKKIGLDLYEAFEGDDNSVYILTSRKVNNKDVSGTGRERRSEKVGFKGCSFAMTHYGSSGEKRGNLKVIADFFRKLTSEEGNLPEHIIIISTTQSFTKTVYNETANHLNRLNMTYFAPYRKVIVFDEVLGTDNGLYAISKIRSLSWANEVIKLYFDASLHSFPVYKKVQEVFDCFGTLSDMLLFIEDFEKEKPEENIFASHSYPARSLTVISKVLVFNAGGKDGTGDRRMGERTRLAEVLVEDIDKIASDLKKRNQRMFVYVQDRALVMKLAEMLEKAGYKVASYTTNMGVYSQLDEEEETVDQNVDIIISTSTLSRGITLSNNFTTVYAISLHYYNPIGDLLEKIQAIARMRGGDADELDKVIYDVYVVFKDKDMDTAYLKELISKAEELDIVRETIQQEYASLKNMIRELKIVHVLREISIMTFYSFINPEEAKRMYGYVVVPVSYQEVPFFSPMIASDLEMDINWLRDFVSYFTDRSLESSERERGMLLELRALLEGLKTSIIDFKTIHLREGKKFHCPYELKKVAVVEDINNKVLRKLEASLKSLKHKLKPHVRRFTSKENYLEKILDKIEKYRNRPTGDSEIFLLEYIPLTALMWEMARPEEIREVKLLRNVSRSGMIPERYSFLKEKIIAIKREDTAEAISFGIPISVANLISENFPAMSYDTFKHLFNDL